MGEYLVRLPYELLPWQLEVKRDRHRNRTIAAGRRSGKTHLLCDLLLDATTNPASPYYVEELPCWYVAPTYGMAKDIAWPVLKSFTKEMMRPGLINRFYETELKIDFWNGNSIQLKGADNQDSLRGRGLGFLGVDEIALMHRDLWLQVLRPAVSDHKAPVVFIGTPKGYNYFFDLCEMEKKYPDTWRTWRIKTAEAGTIEPAELALARLDMDEQSFRQEYEASFEHFAGQIFHWDEAPLPAQKWDDVFYGLDFGYSIDPAALVRIYRKADEFWAEELLYEKGLTNQPLAQRIKDKGVGRFDPIYCDSAEPKSIQELANERLNAKPCDKGPDSVRAGIDYVRSKKVTVVKGSNNIIREMRSYCWRTDKSGVELPEPVRELDHTMSAIRYAITTHCKRPEPVAKTIAHSVYPD